MTHAGDPNLRVSTTHREQAATTLRELYSEGYIQLDEFESRTAQAYTAITRHDLDRLFVDIPRDALTTALVPVTDQGYVVPQAREHRISGRRERLGVFLLTVLGAATAAAYTSEAGFVLLIPLAFILLYVLKVGPKRWYLKRPSVVERTTQRIGEITRPTPVWQQPRN